MPQGSDPFEPWHASAAALPEVFAHESFEAQVRALLDLAPKASAKDLQALPWEEPHERTEFKVIRDAWALERATKREIERARDERPIDEELQEQFEAAVRTRDMKGAKEAWALWGQVAGSKHARAAQDKEDDYTRLTDHEVMVLAALCHKLRDEPLTDLDVACLEFLTHLEVEA